MTQSASGGETTGSWNVRVWHIAFPMILSNISVPLLGAVDTAVVGHLPEPWHLGAVAVGAMVFNFIYWGFGFLRMGTTGFAAQAWGANDADEVRATMARGFVIGAVIAVALLFLQWPIAWIAFSVVEASGEVESLASEYFHIRILGAPATLANYVFLGWFLGVGHARAALYMQVFLNAINIVLDLVFVLVLDWGVAGVAAATAIAEYCAIGLGVLLARRVLREAGGRFRRDLTLDRGRIRQTLSVNADIFVRTICLVFAFAYFTAQGARMGDLVLAANAVLMNFQMFMAHGLDAFAAAVQTLGGRAIGARNERDFRAAVRVSTFWAAVVAIGFTLAYALFGDAIIGLLTGLDDVRAEAHVYLLWSVFMPLVSIWPFQLDGIFLGATRGKTLRNAMIISVAVYIAAVYAFVPIWGNHGLWLAITLFMALRGITLGWRYPALARSVSG